MYVTRARRREQSIPFVSALGFRAVRPRELQQAPRAPDFSGGRHSGATAHVHTVYHRRRQAPPRGKRRANAEAAASCAQQA